MTENFRNLEDEPFPSFLSTGSCDHATLGNLTLGSALGVPVAASTVAKIRTAGDNRLTDIQASYLEDGKLAHCQSSDGEAVKFALSFKDNLGDADQYIAANRFSDLLVKVSLDEQDAPLPPSSLHPRPSDLGNDLSTGLFTFANMTNKDIMATKIQMLPETAEEDSAASEGADSDRFSGSVSSFLANEKLMSLDISTNSDITDEDLDMEHLQDDELELYFNKLMPPAMQRGHVEGQEIPAAVLPGTQAYWSQPSSAEPDKKFVDDFDQDNFQMPDVRLAATGMDSCPASDEEDTEDELDAVSKSCTGSTRFLLPSTSRQLVGESHRPNFRPGLEGGSSDDEPQTTNRHPATNSGIEHRHSAEGQVINSPITGDGGGGDGSSGSEENGNDGGVSTLPIPPATSQAAYEGTVTRGVGIVGGSAVEEDDQQMSLLLGLGRASVPGQSEMGDRVGPVGTGEAGSSVFGAGATNLSPVNWSMSLDRQEALDAMDNTESAAGLLDSLYLLNRPAIRDHHDMVASVAPNLQETQSSFHLSQVLHELHHSDPEGEPGCETDQDSLGLRGGPCGDTPVQQDSSDSNNDEGGRGPSLEAKYLSQSFHEEQEEADDNWNYNPEDLESQEGADGIVYQNEEGQWVTDLAYYSSFAKEVGQTSVPEAVTEQLQTEAFLAGGNVIEKIIEDQEEFEKEHHFMQEEEIEAVNANLNLGDTSWKVPSSGHVLMRASQVSSKFESDDQNYLRISLGEFFQQRSEALGCLGSNDDYVKRPSFGYIITSPEKREPFALIRPSDFSSRATSVHSETLLLSDADKTMNTGDLDNTAHDRTITNGDSLKETTEKHHLAEDQTFAQDEACGVSEDSPNGSSDLLLSISTIASAIADASVSSDPAQLAAMIMELAKKHRSKARDQANNAQSYHLSPLHDQNSMLEALQSSTTGNMSILDMEKYLKIAEISSSDCEASASQSCFDILGWADGLAESQRKPQLPVDGVSALHPESIQLLGEKMVQDSSGATSKGLSSVNSQIGPGSQKSESRRSAIPRSKSSSIPTTLTGASRKSFGAFQSNPKVKPVAQTGPVKQPKTNPDKPTNRVSAESKIKLPTLHPQVSSTPAAGLRRSVNGADASSSAPTTSVEVSGVGQSGILKTSPQAQRNSAGGPSEPEKRSLTRHSASPHTQMDKQMTAVSSQRSLPSLHSTHDAQKRSPDHRAPSGGEQTNCNFRPSTSPLTHSSPSQTSFPSGNGTMSPQSSGGGLIDKSPPHDPLSPQSHCSSPSLSRLTYLSINEGHGMPTPDHKKNTSMALSMTIIRSSPTPPAEDGSDFQNNPGEPIGPSKSSENLYSKSKSSDVSSQNLGPCSKSECNYPVSSDYTSDYVKRHSEPVLRIYTQGDSGYSSNLNIQQKPGGTTTSDQASLVSQRWCGNSGSGAHYGLHPPAYASSDDLRYRAPISSFNSQGVPHDLPASGLLKGPSLFSGQLAQPYLGSDQPLHVPSYHIGTGPNALYGVAAALPGVNPSLGHLPGTLPPGYLNPASVQHPQQYLGTWGARDHTYFGPEVVVPDEIKFPNACCVGIASQTTLSIFNPSDHWQTVGILVTNLSVDGVKVDPLPYQCLIVKNKTIIGPKSTEEQKVLFVAPRAGLYQCTLSVSSWPASAESETVTHAGMFAKRVAVIAVAETPAVEVDIGKSSCLDFGDLPGGSTRALPLRLVNKTRATLPIRLVISANASAWRCFTFSKSPVAMVSEGALLSSGTMPTLSAPSVMNHVLHSSYGDNPEVFMVWVHFHAPQKYLPSSGELGPADDFSARVDIEVDSPGPSHVIQSVCLRARCGTARVHAPKDLQTICLQAPVSHSTKQALPLKNAGNIDVQLRLKSNDNDNCFSVKPEELFLRAGHEQSIHISFNPQDNQKHRESVLTILVLPCGPQYEVVLRGEVVSTEPGKAASLPAAIPQSQVPPILSNKQFMAWGGVTLGRAVQQKLVLRNNSPTAAQQLRLLIRGQDQDCFQLQSSFGQEERLSRHRDLTLRPKEDATVHLLFAPTRVAYMLAKLEIKQSAVRPSQPGVKFTIPLSGYGGTSNIILEDLRKRSDGYVALMTGVAAGRVSKLCVCVRNTGSRAAYVKAVVFSDLQGHKIMNPAVVSLAPSQFVLKERTQEVITVLLKSTRKEQALCQTRPSLLATVTLFCGDEVSRQQYRRLLQSKPEGGKRVLSENSLLKNIPFDEPFLGEEQVQEAFDLPQRPNEVQIFYSNMSKVVLSLLGTIETSDSSESENVESLQHSPRHESDSGFGHTDRQHGNVSLDVLPVKGPPLTSTDVKHTAEQKGTWSIKPDQMVLTAPSISGDADTKHVQIFNPSSHVVNFELSWPAHCLTITPQHGVIEPESHIQILVSPNPSLATKTSLLPWSGHIYIQCDGQQKFVKVQIRKDLAMDVSVSGGSSDKSLHPLPPQAETPPMMGVKPQSRTSSMAHVEIKNRTLVFPTTQSGESSECFLDVENKGEEVRWYISSFAPPYVKGVDSSGDVYRATYTAFRCARVSGSLGPQEKMQIAITFLPRDCGDYAQFWDIECHPVADPQQKSRVRFQLCGTGVRSEVVSGTNQGDCSLVRIESTMKTRKKSDFATTKGGVQDVPKRGVYAPQDVYTFPTTRVGEASTLKVNFRNNSIDSHELKFISPRAPFHIKHSKYSLRSQHYINLPVQFKPTATGRHVGLLVVQTDSGAKLAVELTGESLS